MTLTNDALFQRTPSTFSLPNDGVAKVLRPTDDAQWSALQFELTTFVAEGEYEHGLQRILDSYLRHRSTGQQPAVWVSGFYGSGKSHMVRVLQHLWTDTELPSGARARGLVGLPEGVRASLTELSMIAKRDGAEPWSAAGSLDRSGDSLNAVVLGIVLGTAGLPAKVGPARLALWLIEHGYYDTVMAKLEADGADPLRELNGFNLSKSFPAALLAADPSLARDALEMRAALRAQFPANEGSISTGETLDLLRQVLTHVGGGTIPPTLLILDEVQQYISGDGGRAHEVQSFVEAVTSDLGGRVLLVATGQQELTADPTLTKIKDRFTVKVILKNQDVDVVVRRVLLAKKAQERPALEQAIAAAAGSISRQLAGTRIQHTAKDDDDLVDDYTLLPSRRRLWEEVLRHAGSGTAGQLRSQLRIVHTANQSVAERPVGTVVGADYLYTSENENLNAVGLLLKETQRVIADQAEANPLRGRILGLIHLIGMLPTSGHGDTGVRATSAHLVDLLVEDLAADGPRLRQEVPALLAAMADEGLLQQDGEEFHLQTEAGRTWEEAYRRHRAQITPSEIAVKRDNLLADHVKNQLPARIVQGHANVARPIAFQSGDTRPAVGDVIPVWLRSEWEGVTPRQFEDLTSELGSESPMILVHLVRHDVEGFAAALGNREAAQRTIDQQGNPQDDEGKQALASMQSKLRRADEQVNQHVKDALERAAVRLAGGRRPDGATLKLKIEAAAKDAAVRLFPQFESANKANWDAVSKQVLAGSGADALKKVGFDGTPEQHPVIKEALARIGGAWTPAAKVEELRKAPFGWPYEAVMAAILLLIDGGHIRVQVNGTDSNAAAVARLGTRLGTVQLRRESTVLSPMEKVAAKGLLGQLGFPPKGDDLAAAAEQAVQQISARASAVSGPAPLPQVSLPDAAKAILAAAGNDRVHALLDAKHALEDFVSEVGRLNGRKDARVAALGTARALAVAAQGLVPAQGARDELTAFESSRDLLADVDPITPLLTTLAEHVREAVRAGFDAYEAERAARVAELGTVPEWSALDDGARQHLLAAKRLAPLTAPDLGDPSAVLRAAQSTPLASWADLRDAIAVRAGQARDAAIKAAEPQAVTVRVPGGTVRSGDDVEVYLAQVRAVLEVALAGAETVVVKGS